MRTGKFFKKAALAAAICLSLSQSVWAMPTGGTVESGTVTGFTADPDSGATFTTTAPSIINWAAFGIAANESMNFNTAGGALLNRVQGGNISEIFGTLTQTGMNPMFLVNPNGILVGNGATISANNLVLSTLAMSDSDFSNGVYEFTNPNGSGVAAPITMRGAKINVLKGNDIIPLDGVNGKFLAVGGTITVADGVTFSTAENTSVQLAAAKTYTPSTSYANREGLLTASESNQLTFANSQVEGQGALVSLQGGKVSLSNAKMNLPSGNGKVSITASSNWQESSAYSGAPPDIEMLPTNTVSIDNSNLKGFYLSVRGGKTEVSNSDLSSYSVKNNTIPDFVEHGSIAIFAGSFGSSGSGGVHFSKTADNTVTLKNVNVSGETEVSINGGKVDIEGSSLKTTGTPADSVVIMANESMRYSYNGHRAYYTLGDATHSVTLKDTTVEAGNRQDIWVAGGKVTLDGTTLKSNYETVVAAVKDASYDEVEFADGSGGQIEWRGTAGTDNTVSVLGASSISSLYGTTIAGGNVSIAEKSIVSADGLLGVKSGTAGTLINFALDITGTPSEVAVSADSKLLQNGIDVTDTFATMRPGLSPSAASTISISADERENIEAGQAAMNGLLATSTTMDALQQATQDLVKELNDASGNDRGKAAQVVGVFQAISESDLSDTEKVALQRTAAQTFTPTQIANTEGNSTIESATQSGMSAAAQPEPTANIPANSEDTSAVTIS